MPTRVNHPSANGIPARLAPIDSLAVQRLGLEESARGRVDLKLILAAVHLRVKLHLIPLDVSDLIQLEVLRHVRVEAVVGRGLEQVQQDRVDRYTTQPCSRLVSEYN